MSEIFCFSSLQVCYEVLRFIDNKDILQLDN